MEKLSMIELVATSLFIGASVGIAFRFSEKIGEALGDYCVKRYLFWKQKRMGKK
ncbi:hypothetical protein AB6W78_10130 [Pasteurella multocida]|uniref:hypothetical protein n=1 Tax=Pasteurella multocida TaxID=747 RepID=UPI001AD82764|nr:hypothetical protein [Pasteurella multocida]MCL7838030.1 hypothetical protein [Pasteurella multocida]MCL7843469.1 hypothetical protein [Pasteurella multocida]MDX3887948.1 hypothetical protein [Pasteurella multocida]MDX3890546.1 hypothetical protein [Pasteurella multocida]MDX3896891.1 hypothetical protein [Pasteurella multocida]